MIELRNICKAYRTNHGWNQVLDDISISFPAGRNIGIFGLNGVGKSTLLRMIAGVEPPETGEIYRDINISWPIGFSGGFLPHSSGRDNTRFIARIYNANMNEVENYVKEFSELGEYYDMMYYTYSAGMKARLAFAISMAIEFECYLVDEITSVGDMRFQKKVPTNISGTEKQIISNHSFTSSQHNREFLRYVCCVIQW